MKSFRLFVFLAGAGALVASCSSDDTPTETPPGNDDTGTASVSFTPSCGSPGDHIEIKVDAAACNADETYVLFGDDEATSVKATVSGEAGNYTLDVVVPEGAETGTVTV